MDVRGRKAGSYLSELNGKKHGSRARAPEWDHADACPCNIRAFILFVKYH